MNILTIDTESTGAINETYGNPFTLSNRLCYVGCLFNDSYSDFDIEYSDKPYGKNLKEIEKQIDLCDILVLFNAKFDLHWLERYGITNWKDKKIWDCQAVEFLISMQASPFPSLEGALVSRGLPPKLDIVRTDYWEKGIDTDKVPEEILQEYLKRDVMGTRELYCSQLEQVNSLPKATQTLIRLVNQDVLVLAEMERNGIYYDLEESEKEAEILLGEIDKIDDRLNSFFDADYINWNSGHHISAVLFGGKIPQEIKEEYTFHYKKGGQKQKTRTIVVEHEFGGLTKPTENLATKREGIYKTDEQTLKKLKLTKGLKVVIPLLLERAKLEKLRGTYFLGFIKLHKKMDWEKNILHGQLNQCVTATGRLASSSPNQQNLAEEVHPLIKTRY